ncbi:MAG TPA: hypothetical protein VJ905_08695 [Halalkalibaculum sp.]|nr:hypothetical protein [Halalkalibaculum sp.]
MNAAHYHLIINHVPILATFFSIGILLWGISAKSRSIKKVALVGFVVAGVFAIVAFQTGESAEDIVEDLPGVTHEMIEGHEEAAGTAQWLTILLGVGGLAGLFMISKSTKGVNKYLWILLAYSLVAAASLGYTAYEGGQIRHTELRENTAEAPASSQSQADISLETENEAGE